MTYLHADEGMAQITSILGHLPALTLCLPLPIPLASPITHPSPQEIASLNAWL